MNLTSLAAWLCLSQTQGGGLDLSLEEVTARAVAAARAASESLPQAKGEGRFSYKETELRDGELYTHYQVDSTFTFAYSGKRNFIKFEKSPRREWDDQIYILDGNTLLSSKFSPGLPDGAVGSIQKIRNENGLYSKHGIAPHFLCLASAHVDKPVGREVSLEHDKGLYIIKHAAPEKSTRKFFVDPTKDYHLTRYEMHHDDRLSCVVEKNWAKTSGDVWYVHSYRLEELPIGERQGGLSWEVEFDSFVPNVSIPEEVFTVDALGLPVGATITDMRVSPRVNMTVRPAETDVALIESIVGRLPTAAVRGARMPPAAGSQRLRLWLILVNLGVLLMIVGFVFRRIARTKMRRN